MERLDLDNIRQTWLNPCGSCDAGLPMDCTCPDDDHRNVIFALVSHLEMIYDNHTLLLASTRGEAVDELEALSEARDKVEATLKVLNDPERDWCCSCPRDLRVVTDLLEQQGLDNQVS